MIVIEEVLMEVFSLIPESRKAAKFLLDDVNKE